MEKPLLTLVDQVGALRDDQLWQQEVKGVLLGAIHELQNAFAQDYKDDMPQKDAPDQLRVMADYLRGKSEKPHAIFMAGMHYNSALVRIAAAHHRVMAILTKHDGTAHHLEEYAKEIKLVEPEEVVALRTVYTDVNKFKHQGGRLFKRSPVKTTVQALTDLVGLCERAFKKS